LLAKYNVAIQGEAVGPGILGNKLGLEKKTIHVFDVFDLTTQKYLLHDEAVEMTKKLGLEFVPVLFKGVFNFSTRDDMINFSKGNYASGHPREGVVVRLLNDNMIKKDGINYRASFKVINPDFLTHGQSSSNTKDQFCLLPKYTFDQFVVEGVKKNDVVFQKMTKLVKVLNSSYENLDRFSNALVEYAKSLNFTPTSSERINVLCVTGGICVGKTKFIISNCATALIPDAFDSWEHFFANRPSQKQKILESALTVPFDSDESFKFELFALLSRLVIFLNFAASVDDTTKRLKRFVTERNHLDNLKFIHAKMAHFGTSWKYYNTFKHIWDQVDTILAHHFSFEYKVIKIDQQKQMEYIKNRGQTGDELYSEEFLLTLNKQFE
jgi:hypothetical protein